ncbi:unnamed protein product [Mucor hiemalis]
MPIIELLEDNDLQSLNFNGDSRNYDNLTEEEQTALLDHISSQVANDPSAFEQLATKFLEQTTKADFNTVNVQPQAGFVCKTHVVSTKNKKYPVGTMVFINICFASAIPAPPLTSEFEIQKALNAEPNSTYKIPLSMGVERNDGDKLIMDACIHTQAYLRCEKDLDYRLYILELAMEYVEEICSIHLSREFTMPSIKSKGIIPSRVLRLPKPSLVTAVKNELKSSSVWKLQPTINKENNIITIRIPMPDKNFTSWKVDIQAEKVILTMDNKSMDIILPHLIDIKDETITKVDYFTKSQDLVITLKSITRTQYL